jgi:NAD(P)-dependent dehydrogenase (short-subunit alcohol dehydrogenase family)
METRNKQPHALKPLALVTGSSGSIGTAIVSLLYAQGYAVIGLDRHTSNNTDFFILANLNEFATDGFIRQQILNQIVNYTKPQYKLKLLVNNAAEQLLNSTEDLTDEQWQQTLNVNLTTPFLLSQGLLQELTKAQGSIVNIASIHNKLTKPKFVAYSTSKAGLVGLTKSMAVDLAGKVRVNAISPAAVETPMLKAGFGNETDYLKLHAIHPTGSIGKPQEIAEMVCFLASDKAKFINGANIEIDGGISSVLKDL